MDTYYQQLFPGRLAKGLDSVAKRWNQKSDSNIPLKIPLKFPCTSARDNAQKTEKTAQSLENTGKMQRKKELCKTVHNPKIPPRGVEPL